MVGWEFDIILLPVGARFGNSSWDGVPSWWGSNGVADLGCVNNTFPNITIKSYKFILILVTNFDSIQVISRVP